MGPCAVVRGIEYDSLSSSIYIYICDISDILSCTLQPFVVANALTFGQEFEVALRFIVT